MSKVSYYEKLQHPLWQQRRLEIMNKWNFKCEQCDSDDIQLNVHHLYYVSGRDPWQYPDWALRCLCKDCHKEKHEQIINAEGTFTKESFEDMITWLEGDNYDFCFTWDLCAEYGMLREDNPELLHEFNNAVFNFARETRLRLKGGIA